MNHLEDYEAKCFQHELDHINGITFDKRVSKLKFDIIYFDAFSPNTQPELWTKSIFIKMYNILKDDGFLVTYCAKGSFRRNPGIAVIEFTGVLQPGLPLDNFMAEIETRIEKCSNNLMEEIENNRK